MGSGTINHVLSEQRQAQLAAVFAANGGETPSAGASPLARMAGKSIGTTAYWLDVQRPVLHGLRRYNRDYHQDLLADRTIGLLERIDPDSPQDANEIKCLAIATGILSDKLLLLQGAPTSIIGHLEPRRERVLEAAKLLARLQSQLPSGDTMSQGL